MQSPMHVLHVAPFLPLPPSYICLRYMLYAYAICSMPVLYALCLCYMLYACAICSMPVSYALCLCCIILRYMPVYCTPAVHYGDINNLWRTWMIDIRPTSHGRKYYRPTSGKIQRVGALWSMHHQLVVYTIRWPRPFVSFFLRRFRVLHVWESPKEQLPRSVL